MGDGLTPDEAMRQRVAKCLAGEPERIGSVPCSVEAPVAPVEREGDVVRPAGEATMCVDGVPVGRSTSIGLGFSLEGAGPPRDVAEKIHQAHESARLAIEGRLRSTIEQERGRAVLERVIAMIRAGDGAGARALLGPEMMERLLLVPDQTWRSAFPGSRGWGTSRPKPPSYDEIRRLVDSVPGAREELDRATEPPPATASRIYSRDGSLVAEVPCPPGDLVLDISGAPCPRPPAVECKRAGCEAMESGPGDAFCSERCWRLWCDEQTRGKYLAVARVDADDALPQAYATDGKPRGAGVPAGYEPPRYKSLATAARSLQTVERSQEAMAGDIRGDRIDCVIKDDIETGPETGEEEEVGTECEWQQDGEGGWRLCATSDVGKVLHIAGIVRRDLRWHHNDGSSDHVRGAMREVEGQRGLPSQPVRIDDPERPQWKAAMRSGASLFSPAGDILAAAARDGSWVLPGSERAPGPGGLAGAIAAVECGLGLGPCDTTAIAEMLRGEIDGAPRKPAPREIHNFTPTHLAFTNHPDAHPFKRVEPAQGSTDAGKVVIGIDYSANGDEPALTIGRQMADGSLRIEASLSGADAKAAIEDVEAGKGPVEGATVVGCHVWVAGVQARVVRESVDDGTDFLGAWEVFAADRSRAHLAITSEPWGIGLDDETATRVLDAVEARDGESLRPAVDFQRVKAGRDEDDYSVDFVHRDRWVRVLRCTPAAASGPMWSVEVWEDGRRPCCVEAQR